MIAPQAVAIADQGDAARAATRQLIVDIREQSPNLWVFPNAAGPWAARLLATVTDQTRRHALCRHLHACPVQPVVIPGPRVRICGPCYLDAVARLGEPAQCQQCQRPHQPPTRPIRLAIAQAGWTLAASALCSVCITAEQWNGPPA